MTEPETPQSLLEFFRMLAPEDQDGSCQMHYGCGCVLRKGLLAAAWLVEARAGRDIEFPPQPSTQPSLQPSAAPPDAELTQALAAVRESEAKLEAALAAEKSRADGLLKQNMKLADETIALRGKVQALQRQVNRLYDTMQMKSIHQSLGQAEGAAPATSATPAAPPATFEEHLMEDSAARVPRDPAPEPPPAPTEPAAPGDTTNS